MSEANTLPGKLFQLIEKGEALNLEYRDRIVAGVHIEDGEYDQAFNHILDQFDDYQIPADEEFYTLVAEIAAMMKIPESDYVFLKDQIAKA
jgi:hypothetical protein